RSHARDIVNTLANILIDGLAYGMVLFVIAVGLSITLGLMRFVNLSHGAFAMLGGYVAAMLTREAQWSFWLALPAAVLATALFGAGLLVAAGAAWIVARTRFGVWLRAAVDHSGTASTLGIPIRLVQCASFAAGAALAGLGGILGAELMPLEPYYALKYLLLVL